MHFIIIILSSQLGLVLTPLLIWLQTWFLTQDYIFRKEITRYRCGLIPDLLAKTVSFPHFSILPYDGKCVLIDCYSAEKINQSI